MWKPYNCSVAQNEQIVNLTKNAFLYLSKCDLKDLLRYITSAITIVAFLLAVDYFAAKPSLRIAINTKSMGYYMDFVLEYYQANDIEFPRQLMEDKSLHGLFGRNNKPRDLNYMQIWISDEALIRAIVKGQKNGSSFEYRINQLEKQLGRYTYVGQIYGITHNIGAYSEQKFRPILDIIKSKLSNSDYYIFLAALIRSREIVNLVFIRNDGDLDLKNVRVTFPAPWSKVTESRATNILSCKPATSLLHEVVDATSDITLRLPSFKKGESLSINIRTRENEINRNEVFTSYERGNLIDKARAFLYFFLIFIIMIVLSKVLRGQSKACGN